MTFALMLPVFIGFGIPIYRLCNLQFNIMALLSAILVYLATLYIIWMQIYRIMRFSIRRLFVFTDNIPISLQHEAKLTGVDNTQSKNTLTRFVKFFKRHLVLMCYLAAVLFLFAQEDRLSDLIPLDDFYIIMALFLCLIFPCLVIMYKFSTQITKKSFQPLAAKFQGNINKFTGAFTGKFSDLDFTITSVPEGNFQSAYMSYTLAKPSPVRLCLYAYLAVNFGHDRSRDMFSSVKHLLDTDSPAFEGLLWEVYCDDPISAASFVLNPQIRNTLNTIIEEQGFTRIIIDEDKITAWSLQMRYDAVSAEKNLQYLSQLAGTHK